MKGLRAGSVRAGETRLVAVIDIGAIGIRILVAEIQPTGEFRVVDRSERPMGLGRDVFTNGLISREAMAQSLEILRRFREMLDGWKIARRDIHVIATSALREARNRDTFVDRVELRTGFKIGIIEGVEANRLTYIAVRFALGEQQAHLARSNSIIIEVGGGTTEIMLLEHGHMVSAHSLSVGTARIEPQLESVFGSSDQLLRFLGENVRTTTEILNSELRLKSVRNFIAVGGDARMAAQQVGEPIGEHISVMSREAFESFYERIQALSVDGCVRELSIPYADAESLIPALMIYRMLLHRDRRDAAHRARREHPRRRAAQPGARPGPRPAAGVQRRRWPRRPSASAASTALTSGTPATSRGSRCGSSTSCGPSTGSTPSTACSCGWPRSCTTSGRSSRRRGITSTGSTSWRAPRSSASTARTSPSSRTWCATTASRSPRPPT